jgi:uncharacterized protein YbbC (DUF1343 family)
MTASRPARFNQIAPACGSLPPSFLLRDAGALPTLPAMNRRAFIRNAVMGAAVTGAASFTGCASRPPAGTPAVVTRPPEVVLNGIDVLQKQNFAPLRSLRVGLITNHTGHDRQRRPTLDLLHGAPGLKLAALFSPEHGIRGELDEKFQDSTDRQTGLPVFSLYGQRRSPTPEQLQELDALVFDIQDIGCRFYTYPSTMGLCLEAAGKAKLKFFVLDRVNPINGLALEGPLHTGASSFVAFHTTPLRHGMTVGELARMYNAEKNYHADLTVVPAEGWHRMMWFDDTKIPWTNPSPNMRNLAAATLYPGIGLHEFAICVGRGTDKPFELIGAPYIDGPKLAAELNAAALPGVRCAPVRFTPTYSTFKDVQCEGVAFAITDRLALNAVDLGITLALVLQRRHPGQFAVDKLDKLLQHAATSDAIKAGRSLGEIRNAWAAELAAFAQRRRQFLIYS